jgi:hypothetical protein
MDSGSIQSWVSQASALRWLVPAAAMLAGLTLCMAGVRIVRPTCAVCGLILGAAAGLIAAHAMDAARLTPVWVVMGSVAGALLVWLLFRLWMGVGLAAVLAVVLPGSLLAAYHQTPPVAPRTMISQEVQPGSSATLASPAWIERSSDRHWSRDMNRAWARQVDAVDDWWDGLGQPLRRLLIAGSITGAIVGLVAGLVAPYAAAGIGTATFGAVLVLLALRDVVVVLAPSMREAWRPHDSTAALTAMGLITVVSLLLQWTLRRKPADK